MAALATVAQLEARLGRDIPAGTETTRATALLDDVSAAIRAYTGQAFAQDVTTVRLRARGYAVRLAQRAVNDVTAVVDVEGNAVEFTWHAGSLIKLSSLPLDGWVDVTYDHGDDTVPDAIVAIACQIAGRALGTKADSAGITQETIGSYSYSIGAAAAAGAFGILESEKAILDLFAAPQLGIAVIG